MRRALSIVALMTVVSACTHQQAWVATGESIDALGQTFLVTGRALDAAYDAKQVPEAQYEKWRTFVKYFKVAFELAADRWKHGDDSAAKHAAVVLATLSVELAAFALPAADGGT